MSLTYLVLSEISQQLLDALPSILVHAYSPEDEFKCSLDFSARVGQTFFAVRFIDSVS